MPKAAPFSMRLSDVIDQLVSEEAKRTRRTKGAVVEGLAEERQRSQRERAWGRGHHPIQVTESGA